MRSNRNFRVEDNLLNTNETINDYSFYFQMICENKMMDFEANVTNKWGCEEGV